MAARRCFPDCQLDKGRHKQQTEHKDNYQQYLHGYLPEDACNIVRGLEPEEEVQAQNRDDSQVRESDRDEDHVEENEKESFVLDEDREGVKVELVAIYEAIQLHL